MLPRGSFSRLSSVWFRFFDKLFSGPSNPQWSRWKQVESQVELDLGPWGDDEAATETPSTPAPKQKANETLGTATPAMALGIPWGYGSDAPGAPCELPWRFWICHQVLSTRRVHDVWMPSWLCMTASSLVCIADVYCCANCECGRCTET